MEFTFDNPACLQNALRVHDLSDDLRLIASFKAPGIRDIAMAPVLDDWFVGHRMEMALVGKVSCHPNLADGPVTTSGLHYLDPLAGYARSFNRWYRLGRPRAL